MNEDTTSTSGSQQGRELQPTQTAPLACVPNVPGVIGELAIHVPVQVKAVINHINFEVHQITAQQFREYRAQCREFEAARIGWQTPLAMTAGLLPSVTIPFPLDFFFVLPGTVWKAVFIVGFLASAAWTIKAVIAARGVKPPTLTNLG